jgi:hypothetical protein
MVKYTIIIQTHPRGSVIKIGSERIKDERTKMKDER